MLVLDTCLRIEVFQLLAVVQVTIFFQPLLKRLLVDKSVAVLIEQLRNGIEIIVFGEHVVGYGVVFETIHLQVYQLATIHQVQIVHVGFRRELHAGIISHRGFRTFLGIDGGDDDNAIGCPRTIN